MILRILRIILIIGLLIAATPVLKVTEYRMPKAAVVPITKINLLQKRPKVAVVPTNVPRQVFQKPVSRGSTDRILTGFDVTWYNNTGITHTTASGTRTTEGRTLGVDPKIIPLGTWVEILMPDGSVLKRRAEDTGAAKGRILDVYADKSDSELLQRGRTKGVTIRILGG